MILRTPHAFLCHASEDKPTVKALANVLLAQGVDVFFDEWEIGPGDSIRTRIEQGLGLCSHFVAVLSPISIQKSWVNLELDAGLVRRLEGQAKFIPLRIGLSVSSLPYLFQGMYSPELNDPNVDGIALAAFMHGISNKPQVGEPPSAMRQAVTNTGLSPAAQAVARLMIERSQQGRTNDPALPPEIIMQSAALSEDDMIDGVDELAAQGYLNKQLGLGIKHFAWATPTKRFFIAFDPIFGSNNPKKDAVTVAALITNQPHAGASAAQLTELLQWPPRRLNPALEYLVLNDIIQAVSGMDANWTHLVLQAIPETRRFVRSNQ